MTSPGGKVPPGAKVVSPARMQSLLRPGSSPVTKTPLLPTPTTPRFPTPPGRRPSSSIPVAGPESKDSKLTSKTPTIKLKPIPMPLGSDISKPRDPRIPVATVSPVTTASSVYTKPSPGQTASSTSAAPVPQVGQPSPAKMRGRKGSLTAVIDKLTKSHPGPAESEQAASAPPGAEGKRNIFDSLSSKNEATEKSNESTSGRPRSEKDDERTAAPVQAVGDDTSACTERVLETPESPPVEEKESISRGKEREIPVEPLASSPAHTRIDSAPQSPDPEPAHNLMQQKTVEIPIAAKDTEASSRQPDYDDVMFKAPTPKTPQSVGNKSPKAGDMPEFGKQDSAQMRSRSNSVTSSHPSSPEDGLVIACSPGTPKGQPMSPHSSKQRASEPIIAERALPSESARSPLPSAQEKVTPATLIQKCLSPAATVKSPATTSVKSALSPCMIDDDLMDEALGFGN